ncbi:alanine racemase [Croceicoccus bisphenolivorans]|uniref:alanine racemase n=1 Tax=Croceicoccus bisphenolivorans TaxID=1783232 RepID=UPI00082EAFC0|nr:alanine racemase [Croceicoccus bisphenolivorans]
MPDSPMAPPPAMRLRVDSGAISDNWRTLDAMSGTARAAAAVKADAYGVGIDRAMPTLLDAGCRDFYVAHWCEVAGAIRHAAPENVAVLHGPITQADCEYARQTGVRPVLNSLAQVGLWQSTGGGPCDLMVDSGMNRLGLRPDELGDPALAGLEVITFMSHLACADEDSAMNGRQRDLFASLLAAVPHRRASLANSAGIALGAGFQHDLTRPGVALYGGVVRSELVGKIRPVVGLEAALIQVRTVPAGETVGYGAAFTAQRDTRVGIVSLGYADGYLRCWSDVGVFRSGNAPLPVLGRVSMDMTAIDLSSAPDLAEGDWVSAEYDLPTAAQRSGLTQYELLTVLGPRLRA